MSNPATDSFFCIHEIVNDDRTALNISTRSEFHDEDEAWILSYSAFLITKIEQGQETTNICSTDQCLTHMLDSNESEEYSTKSTACPLEAFGDIYCITRTKRATIEQKSLKHDFAICILLF
ncbi:unnamed protein product [Rotaria sp. Silwood2]|nr:unnamed protein product [Rotaria sp. Silwood2]CAF4465536.1 unnamed protein product [Rotaria sp. Silwood2]